MPRATRRDEDDREPRTDDGRRAHRNRPSPPADGGLRARDDRERDDAWTDLPTPNALRVRRGRPAAKPTPRAARTSSARARRTPDRAVRSAARRARDGDERAWPWPDRGRDRKHGAPNTRPRE